jgi:hypothetical protein
VLPKCPELLDAPLRRIPRDERAVNRTDRDAGNPIRLQFSLRECGIYAGLVGAECTAALQQQSNAIERGALSYAARLCRHGGDCSRGKLFHIILLL